jgi:MFS transporter, ACS family, glucarate transporter
MSCAEEVRVNVATLHKQQTPTTCAGNDLRVNFNGGLQVKRVPEILKSTVICQSQILRSELTILVLPATMNIFRNHVRWWLIAWMFVISAVAYLDRVNISIAGSLIEKEFGFDHVHLGWALSAFLLGYALFQAPGGRLADRYGPRRILTVGTIWWAVFTSLTAAVSAELAGALFVLMAVRFLLGVGEAVVYPAGNRLVASWIPSQERGVANGLIFAGVGAGAGVTPPLITYIMVHRGWRWSFWISALIGLLAGLVWLAIARDRPEQHPLVSPEEATYIRVGLPATSNQRPLPWRNIFFSKDVVAVTLSYFCYGYVAYIFFSWFFIYLNAVRGLNLKSSSYYSMLPFLAMAAGSTIGGWISDVITRKVGRRAGRCGVACASMLLCTIFVASGAFAQDARVASVILAGGAGALYLSQSSFWSVTSEIGGSSAGSVSGVMNMGGQIGGMVTASLTPLIAKHFGWDTSFFVAAGLCSIGALLWLMVRWEMPHFSKGARSGAPRRISNFRSGK